MAIQKADRIQVSIASFWEIAIKLNLGKLETDLGQLEKGLARDCMHVLPIQVEHCRIYQTLPQHRRDPFDRLLIAQALTEQLTLATTDRHLFAYDPQLMDASL